MTYYHTINETGFTYTSGSLHDSYSIGVFPLDIIDV